MSILEKIGRILLWPTEKRMLAQNVQWDRENEKINMKANEIIQNFKREVANDPEIQRFLKDYDKKYTLKYH